MTNTGKIILGIDEVGRGPWAGPLVIGAVILTDECRTFVRLNENSILDKNSKFQDPNSEKLISNENSKSSLDKPDKVPALDTESFKTWQSLADSKKLTAKRREQIAQNLNQITAASATGWVSAVELDQYGLSASLRLATRRAVKQILQTKIRFDEIIIDGTINFLDTTPLTDRVTLLKKADSLVKEVSAASILAKVARDRYMAEIATQYPAYGFEKHVGYGTALHQKALLEHGICPEHRKSFRPVQKILTESPQNTSKTDQNSPICPTEAEISPSNFSPLSSSQKGQKAELAVATHLQQQDHKIIAHNFKTKTYEIDLISIKNQQIFFTEVKYSQNPTPEGTPLARITDKKLSQMHYAAEKFLTSHPEYNIFTPILAVAAVSGENYTINSWFPILED